ncbi:hypothetical protein HMPREF3223_00510 [Cutibacterium avidum]|nr:hypothetical protein HMPREF3223_00510 [Cutibacterium avidum]
MSGHELCQHECSSDRDMCNRRQRICRAAASGTIDTLEEMGSVVPHVVRRVGLVGRL